MGDYFVEKTTDNECSKLFENYSEVSEPEDAIIEGEIPSWLNVTLLRNGPGLNKIGGYSFAHWFDGLAFMQRFCFKDGEMKYSARYLQSEAYHFHKANERVVINKHGHIQKLPDPCKIALGPLSTTNLMEDGIYDNSSINFMTVGDTVWATSESPKLHQIDPNTLDTIGKTDIRKIITLNTFTAHQQYDHDGNIYHIGITYGLQTTYVFAITKNPENSDAAAKPENPFTETSIIGTIPATDEPCYFHSFGMTENYIIAFEAPLRLNLHSDDFTNLDCLFWKKDTPVYVRVLDKRTGKEIVDRKFRHSPFFVFHHANAYEKDGCLVVDYCQFSHPDLHLFDLESMRKGSLAALSKEQLAFGSRMIIPVETEIDDAKVGDDLLKDKGCGNGYSAILKENGEIWLEQKILCDIGFEFPRYNLSYNLKPYKFIYGSILLGMPESLDGLIKLNVETGKIISWHRDHNKQIATEPVFIPHPDAKDEDDGLILAPVVTFKDDDLPFIVVLDAKNFAEIARCKINHPLPLSFHAQFYPNLEL